MSQPAPTHTYLGLTIGPIYRTLAPLRRTRALFAGSYLISYVMRRLLFHLTDEGSNEHPNENRLKGKILIPYMPTDKAERKAYLSGGKGVGLFPDRLLIEAEEGDFGRLKRVRNVVLNELVETLNAGKSKQQVTTEFIQQYMQVYCLSAQLPEGTETINELNRLLENTELRQSFVNQKAIDPNELVNYLSESKLDRTAGTLMEDAFGEGKNPAFTSLPEIAVKGLRATNPTSFDHILKEWVKKETQQENETQQDNELLKTLQTDNHFRTHFRQHHKYVAIIEADGDNMGSRIGAMNANPEQLGQFSKTLYEFGQQARKIIQGYGGSPVYIGGDDLVFFAPVATLTQTGQMDQTIFDCLTALDDQFNRSFPLKGGEQPTLSYGVSISYYKYPLNEARAEAHSLLKKAKEQGNYPHKNAVEFKILKNAGTYFAAGFSKSEPYYKTAKALIGTNISDTQWLNSAIYFVQYFDTLLPHLSAKEIENLFRNRLDEAIHKRNEDFLYTLLPIFIHEVYESFRQLAAWQSTQANEQTKQQKSDTEGTQQIKAQALIHSTLRFVQFIRTNRDGG